MTARIYVLYTYICIYKWPGCSNAEGLEETNDKDWNGFLNNVGKYTLKSLAPHNSGSMNVLFCILICICDSVRWR